MENEVVNTRLLSVYRGRINAVIDYIEKHISEALTLEELSQVANFSKFHFHRVFFAMTGERLYEFIQRLRIQKGATLLSNRSDLSITDIALECGFSGSAAFSRRFRAVFQKTPSQWRKDYQALGNFEQDDRKMDQAQSNAWKDKIPPILYNYDILREKRRTTMNEENRKVTIKTFPTMTAAYVRYMGPYKGNSKLFESLFSKLCAWAEPRGLLKSPKAQFLIIYHDDPEITAEEKLRVSVCVTVPPETAVDGEIGKMEIPAGTYASAYFELGEDEYQQAWDWVYGVWLPSSGYVPDDRPCFELYPPAEKDRTDGKTPVEICIPVKPV